MSAVWCAFGFADEAAAQKWLDTLPPLRGSSGTMFAVIVRRPAAEVVEFITEAEHGLEEPR